MVSSQSLLSAKLVPSHLLACCETNPLFYIGRYFQCIHQRLYHLTPNDYEDFVSVIVHAKRAFNWLIEGPNAFQQLLSSIKRSVALQPQLPLSEII